MPGIAVAGGGGPHVKAVAVGADFRRRDRLAETLPARLVAIGAKPGIDPVAGLHLGRIDPKGIARGQIAAEGRGGRGVCGW